MHANNLNRNIMLFIKGFYFLNINRQHKEIVANKVIFARANMDLNDFDGINNDNSPHIKLYKAGLKKNKTLTLHDKKSEEGLTVWLRKNSNYGELFGRSEL
jgi:hypothetical protein